VTCPPLVHSPISFCGQQASLKSVTGESSAYKGLPMKARLCRNKPGIVAPFATRESPYAITVSQFHPGRILGSEYGCLLVQIDEANAELWMQECRHFEILPERRKCIMNCGCWIGSCQARIEMCLSTRETADLWWNHSHVYLASHDVLCRGVHVSARRKIESRGTADSGSQGRP
jgi:hypothetical protein